MDYEDEYEAKKEGNVLASENSCMNIGKFFVEQTQTGSSVKSSSQELGMQLGGPRQVWTGCKPSMKPDSEPNLQYEPKPDHKPKNHFQLKNKDRMNISDHLAATMHN